MKSGLIIGILLITGIGYVAAGPYITVDQITTGIEEQNWQQLSENIDFPLVRQNIKNQINARIKEESTTKLGDNSLGAFATGLAATIADNMVDSFVTPSALASLMTGNKPLKNVGLGSTDASAEKATPFNNATYSYDSIDHFSVWVPNDGGNAIRFVLHRDGIKWKLANIVIPADYKI